MDFTAKREMTIPAKIENLDELYALIEEALEAEGCPMLVEQRISVAVDEACANVVNYAYPDGEGTLKTTVETGAGLARITFEDEGVAFDPLARKTSAVTSKDPPIGGLGIHLIKELMDEVRYERKDGKNILTILKKWEEM